MLGRHRVSVAAVLSVAVGSLAAVGLSLLLARLFGSGMSQSYDTTLYARSLWGIAHGSGFNPVYGMDWLGIHANWVLVLLAPAALIWRPSSVLVAAQAMAYGATVGLVFHAVTRSGSAGLAPPEARVSRSLAAALGLVGVALAPLVVNPFLFDARPDLIAVPLLLAGMLRAERLGRFDRGALAWLFAAALVREEFALIAAFTILVAPVPTGRGGTARRAMFAGILVLYFAAYWWGVRPALVSAFAASRADEAAADLFRVTTPGAGRFRLAFGLCVLAFGGGLALRGWRWLPAALPGLGFVALSGKMAEHALSFHYPMFAAPALAMAAIVGIRAVAADDRIRIRIPLLVAALGVSIAATVVAGSHPFGRRFAPEFFAMDESAAGWLAECHAALALVPLDAGVAMPAMFGAPMAGREVIWSMETLTRHMVEHGEVPAGIDWIGVDNQQFASLGQVLANRHGFVLVRIAAGRLAIFRRSAGPTDPPPILQMPGVARACAAPQVVWPEAGMAFCELGVRDGRLTGVIQRYWAAGGADRTGTQQAGEAKPLALVAEVDGQPTNLRALFGLLDPSTLPIGTGVAVVSSDRVSSPRFRLHLQDISGRNFMGSPVRDGQAGPPTLGVPMLRPAAE